MAEAGHLSPVPRSGPFLASCDPRGGAGRTIDKRTSHACCSTILQVEGYGVRVVEYRTLGRGLPAGFNGHRTACLAGRNGGAHGPEHVGDGPDGVPGRTAVECCAYSLDGNDSWYRPNCGNFSPDDAADRGRLDLYGSVTTPPVLTLKRRAGKAGTDSMYRTERAYYPPYVAEAPMISR